jgi:hypothetical protein
MADDQAARANAHRAPTFEREFDDLALIVIVIVTGRQIDNRFVGEGGIASVELEVDWRYVARTRFGLRRQRRLGKPTADAARAR